MDWLADRPEWLARTVEDILDPALEICDAHHHLWDNGPGKRYLLEEIERDAASGHNIVATIFCECRQQYRKDGPEELKPAGEVAFVDALASRSDRIARGIIGYADFRLGAAVERTLEAHRQASRRFCGVRHMTRWHEAAEALDVPPRSPRNVMADRTWREGFAKLAGFGLPFDAWFLFTQYDEIV